MDPDGADSRRCELLATVVDPIRQTSDLKGLRCELLTVSPPPIVLQVDDGEVGDTASRVHGMMQDVKSQEKPRESDGMVEDNTERVTVLKVKLPRSRDKCVELGKVKRQHWDKLCEARVTKTNLESENKSLKRMLSGVRAAMTSETIHENLHASLHDELHQPIPDKKAVSDRMKSLIDEMTSLAQEHETTITDAQISIANVQEFKERLGVESLRNTELLEQLDSVKTENVRLKLVESSHKKLLSELSRLSQQTDTAEVGPQQQNKTKRRRVS